MLRTSANNQKRDEGGSDPFEIDGELTHRDVTTEVIGYKLGFLLVCQEQKSGRNLKFRAKNDAKFSNPGSS